MRIELLRRIGRINEAKELIEKASAFEDYNKRFIIPHLTLLLMENKVKEAKDLIDASLALEEYTDKDSISMGRKILLGEARKQAGHRLRSYISFGSAAFPFANFAIKSIWRVVREDRKNKKGLNKTN